MSDGTKKCGRCKVAKPFGEFFRRKRSKDGFQEWCKSCKRSYARDYNKIPERRKKNREYERNLYWTSSKYRKSRIAAISRYNKIGSSKMKFKAKGKVSYAIKKGLLVRPDSCEACGIAAVDKTKGVTVRGGWLGCLDAHHESYKKEHWLDVVWLCRICHRKAHNNPEFREEHKDILWGDGDFSVDQESAGRELK